MGAASTHLLIPENAGQTILEISAGQPYEARCLEAEHRMEKHMSQVARSLTLLAHI